MLFLGRGSSVRTFVRLSMWLSLLLSVAPRVVLAAPIQVSIAGTIDSISAPSELPGGLAVGDAFTGEYTFESISPGAPSEESPGVWIFPVDSTSSVSVELGGAMFTASPNALTTANDIHLGDGWANLPSPGSGIAPQLIFLDSTASRISDPTSYFVATSLLGWTSAEILLIDTDVSGSGALLEGTITSVQAIPEPGVALLLGLGLGGIAWRSRRGGGGGSLPVSPRSCTSQTGSGVAIATRGGGVGAIPSPRRIGRSRHQGTRIASILGTLLSIGVLTALQAEPAFASTVIHRFDGIVTFDGFDGSSVFQVGDSFSATVAYDTTATEDWSSDPAIGQFRTAIE
ncbi:MAG: PEP-CTERM sorting domain-containing protein, partial [bacterium]